MTSSSQPPAVQRHAILVAALMLCFLAGCYEHVSRGNESIYRFEWWLGPAIIAGGILAVPVSWFLRKWKWGFVLLVMGPILLVIVAPSLYSDRVLIDDDRFEARYGFWFSPTIQQVRFADLREIRYVAVRVHRGRTDYELHCVNDAGKVDVVPAGDLVINAVPEILARAKARGVRIVELGP